MVLDLENIKIIDGKFIKWQKDKIRVKLIENLLNTDHCIIFYI